MTLEAADVIHIHKFLNSGGTPLKRVAFVRIRYLPPSETFIYEELKNIKRHKAIVFTRKRMNLKRFPYSKIKELPDNTRKMVKLFRANKIRLIHARFGNAGVRMAGVKRRLHIPLLTSFHGYDLPTKQIQDDPYQRSLKKLFKAGDKFTVPSRQMKYLLRKWGCPGKKIKIMYSGIDMKKFPYTERKPKTDGITFIAVGRLIEKKGYKYLIKAFKSIHDRYPNSRLIIIGYGNDRKNLNRLRKALNLRRHVKLKGYVEHKQIYELLKEADIFCLPSLTSSDGNQEGIPNAIKEAMATGLPVVSTRHGGIPELVAHGREGLLVPEKNDKELAKAMLYMIQNPSVRLEMGRRGRKKVERQFNSSKQVKRLESIYRKLIKKGRK